MEELAGSLNTYTVFELKLFGLVIPVSDTIVIMWFIMAAIIFLAFIFTRKMKQVPSGRQNFIETIVELINNLAKNNIGHHGMLFAPYLGTVLIFLVISNTISIFNIIPNGEQLHKLTHLSFFEHWPHFALRPPTKDVNVTAALALMSMTLVFFSGIRIKKIKGFLHGFIEPTPVVLPFKMLDYFVRPLSLCFRLFGNILGAFLIMEMIYTIIPLIVPGALSMYFDLFDGMLQALIFVFLTSLYISEAVESEVSTHGN